MQSNAAALKGKLQSYTLHTLRFAGQQVAIPAEVVFAGQPGATSMVAGVVEGAPDAAVVAETAEQPLKPASAEERAGMSASTGSD